MLVGSHAEEDKFGLEEKEGTGVGGYAIAGS